MPRLVARLDPVVAGLLEGPDRITDLVERFGSPLHVVLPGVLEQNAARLVEVLADGVWSSRLFYANKVNTSPSFVAAAARSGLGVDVASTGELAGAVARGVPAERIEVTGPKGARLLDAALDAGALVNIDSHAELELLVALAERRPVGSRPAPVLLRLGGFSFQTAAGRHSRFGIPLGSVEASLQVVADARHLVDLRGVSFHLDSGEVSERTRAVAESLAVLERAWAAELAATVLDIGGGLRQVHLAEPAAFDRYLAALRRGLLGKGRPLTWNGNPLGQRVEEGSVRGTPVVHKYANATPADDMLRQLLRAPLDGHRGRSLADVLADNLVELWLEPGKALVDQAGLTVATVELVSLAADGNPLVLLDLSRDRICPADQEVFVDPVLLPRSRSGSLPGPAACYLAGDLCLERDLISNRLVAFDQHPRRGDLVVFVNTAAYHMDLSASVAAGRPLPVRVVVTSAPDGTIEATREN